MMPTDPLPEIDAVTLRKRIEIYIASCGANYHIVRQRHGLDDILDTMFGEDDPPDACKVGRRILMELTTTERSRWSPYASDIFIGVIKFMRDCGFAKPTKERIQDFKTILGTEDPDVERIGRWFDSVYTGQKHRTD